MAYVEGDFPIQTGNNEGGFGSGGWWAGLIGLIAVAAIFGRNGGLFGGNGQAVTQADLCTSLNFNNLDSSVRSIGDSVNVGFANLNSTICNQQYDTARMIDGVNTAMLQGFNGINVTNLQGFNALQAQLAQCCCNLERGQERILCGEAQNTAAIIQATKDGTQAVLGYLCNEKLVSQAAEIAELKGIISQRDQSNFIVGQLRPFPTASYVVPNPFTGSYGGYACGCNSGCGCSGSVL